MPELQKLKKLLRSKASPAKAKIFERFFKTAPGQYGHGDVFLGLTVPTQRQIAKRFYHLSLADIQKLLLSKIHEERFTALVILVHQFTHAPVPLSRHSGMPLAAAPEGDHWGVGATQKQIFNFYLKNSKRINNWDLVDTSAPQIVGEYLRPLSPLRGEMERGVLVQLAHSKNLWERRIAILATFTFIRHNEFNQTLHLAKLLLNDKHDLIHKAAGWMLREVGKKSEPTLKKFLGQHAHEMPRTMLRYAIEKLSPNERQKFLIAKQRSLARRRRASSSP